VLDKRLCDLGRSGHFEFGFLREKVAEEKRVDIRAWTQKSREAVFLMEAKMQKLSKPSKM